MTTTIETVLRADSTQFRRATRQAAQDFQQGFRGMAQTARASGNDIRRASERLGVRPFRNIQAEIRRVRNDYRLLSATGSRSSRELVQANIRMQNSVRRLRQEQGGMATALEEARGGLLAVAAVTAGVTLGLNNAASAASEFAQGMAEVNTLLAGDDPVRLARLSAQVRATAVDLGATLPDATQSLYNILSAGVPEGNAIEVLQQSTRAAIAGVTDTNTAARGGLAVINAYDRGVDELSDVFDVLFSTVRRGVTTLPELTQNLGQVLPIAAAADVPFEELAGAVARLTQVGVRTPQATTALRGAIVGLQTPTEAARKAMDELGIEWDGLLGTLEQISALDLAAEELREIIPEVEGRLAVLALADNMDGLRDSIEGMSSSAGATDAAYAKMADTPEQRMRRFSAVLADIRVDLGDMVLQGVLPAAEALGSLAQTVAGLPAEFRVMLGLIAGITLAQAAWAIGLRQAYNALRLAAAGTLTLNNATRLLLRGVPLAVLAGQVITLTTMFLEHRNEMQRLAQQQERQRENLRASIEANREYADTLILSQEETKNLTLAEAEAYAERLAGLRQYHRDRRREISREQFDPEDPTAPVSAEALEAARREREAREALAALQDQLAEQRTALQDHNTEVARIKAEETDIIRRELAAQLNEYEQAQTDLEQIQQERVAIEEEFASLVDRIRNRGAAGPEEELDFIDIAGIQARARQALAAGDFERAIELAREAGKGLEELQEAGETNTLALAGTAQNIRRIAEEAARAREEAAQANVEQIAGTIEELTARAEFLRRIEIGFDEESAAQSAEQLRAQVQAQLEQNPIVIPVQFGEAPDLSAADELLERVQGRAGGGWIRGAGGPTSDSIPALLSNGEFVLRQRAAMNLMREYGAGFLNHLNRTGRVPGFAGGGLVSAAERLPAVPRLDFDDMPAPGPAGTPVHLHLPGGGSVELAGGDDEVRRLRRALSREALTGGHA